MNDNTSLREQIAYAVTEIVKQIDNPRIALVTREPFEPDRIAITDFPAVLLQMDVEERETITMGAVAAGHRMGTITYTLRGYVRGVELDNKRNELINALEQSLDANRNLGLGASGVTDSQIISIEIIPRLPPLAEINIKFFVKYNYARGQS